MKYFYRVDGQNHPIPGSLIRVKEKPITGKWKEISGDICCPLTCDLESQTIPTDSPIDEAGEIPSNCTVSAVIFVGDPDDGLAIGDTQSQGGGNIQDFINTLNTYYTLLGTFSYNPVNQSIILKTSACCLNLTLYVDAVCER